jgi:hypothetical protein
LPDSWTRGHGEDPGRSGRRSTAEWKHIPVIILTAKDLTVQDRHDLKGNVEMVLQKGDYNREQLLNEVRQLVKPDRKEEAPANA